VAKPARNVGFASRFLRGESPIAPVEEEPMDAESLEIALRPVDEAALQMQSQDSDERLKTLTELAVKRREMMKVRRLVMEGKKEKTSGGLKKDDLIINKRGQVVSKRQSARGKELYAKFLKGWVDAVALARSKLALIGFIPAGGRTEQGQELYKTAKDIYDKDKSGPP